MKKLVYLSITALFLTLFSSSCQKGKSSRQDGQVDTIPMLVTQIQKCSRLYTVEYRVHKIVTHDDVVRLRGQLFSKDYDVPLPLGDRKVAIPMDATLKAYIDFADFSEENVSREGSKITITLPDPHVVMTDSKIDQHAIREYVSLTRAHYTDRELSAFEQQGREAIIAKIPEMGIIENARLSAARQLVPLMTSLGYREQDVTISFSHDFSVADIRSLLDFSKVAK